MGEKITDKDYYNSIPVSYCLECNSLRIRAYDEKTDYCDDCGSTEIVETDIYTWRLKEEERLKNKKNKSK